MIEMPRLKLVGLEVPDSLEIKVPTVLKIIDFSTGMSKINNFTP
jgi:hypothetical protein